LDDIPYIPSSALAVPGVLSRDLIATEIPVNDQVAAEIPMNNLAPDGVPLSHVVVPTIPSSALTAASVPDSNPTTADVPLSDIAPVSAPLSNLASAGVSEGRDVSEVITDDAIDKAAASEFMRLDEERTAQEVTRKEEETQAAQLVKLGQEAATAEVTRLVDISLKSQTLEVMRLKAAATAAAAVAAAEIIRQEQEMEAEGVLKMTRDGAIKKAEVDGSGLKGADAIVSNLNAQGIILEDSGAIDFDGGDCGGNDDDNDSNESRGKKCVYICIDHIMHIDDVDQYCSLSERMCTSFPCVMRGIVFSMTTCFYMILVSQYFDVRINLSGRLFFL
jgi:hypothetical protein